MIGACMLIAASLAAAPNFHDDGNACIPVSPCAHESDVKAYMLENHGQSRIRRSPVLPEGYRLDIYRSPANEWSVWTTGAGGFSCESFNGQGGDIDAMYRQFINQMEQPEKAQ